MNTGELREVASRLRRRHLRAHLDQWRQLRQHLETVRRSRDKRARLLRLARNHHLPLALERLRYTGMTLVNRGQLGVYCMYNPEATRFHLESVQHSLKQCAATFRELRRSACEHRVANLRTLLEETEVVQDDPLKVRWSLLDVELDGVWIGDMEITLNLEDFDVRVWNRSADTEPRGGFQHPHVNSSGEICWNDADEDACAYHSSGDFLALKDLIDNLLRTYNPASPYITLEDWENGLGECCADCGERYSEDDLTYIEGSGELLCYDCSRYCEHCASSVPYADYDPEWRQCKWCLQETTCICEHCKERFAVEDEVSDEDEGYCPRCIEELRKEFEDGHQDHPGGLLAPAMAVPQNAL